VYFYSATVVYFCSGEWCVFTPALTVAAVALANKNARIVWALLRHGGTYKKPVTVPAV
jgi:hypothetical protein